MTLWSVAVYGLLPYVVASLVWRALRYRAYWYRWPERFGFVPALSDKRIIWLHAVSVGEVRSSAPLIEALAGEFPQHRLLVTTMTPTGSDQVHDLFGDRVMHTYLPYDFPDAVNRFLNRVHPELAIIAETEFWPNLFAACRRRSVPLVLVNVRLSQASFRGYSWVRATAKAMLDTAAVVCTQSSIDAQRLRNLGVRDRKIRITGNLKFDVEVPESLIADGVRLRRDWGGDRPVFIAASTHGGEERLVLEAFELLRARYRNLLLVIVPRHPERFAGVARLAARAGFVTARRTACGGTLDPRTDVLVGDTMGELQLLYAASDVAFVGGSLVPRGGQNPLEACAVSVPVIFGPHMFHFEEISAMALERGAARQVQAVDELAEAVALYFDQPALRLAAGRAAHTLISDNHGALERTLRYMQDASLAPFDVAADARRLGSRHGSLS